MRAWNLRAAAVFAVAFTFACSGSKAPPSSGQDVATPNLPDSTPNVNASGPATAAPSAPSAHLVSSAEPTSDDVVQNVGCKFRKSTNLLSRCEKHARQLGSWTPAPGEVAGALERGKGLCYCVDDFEKLARSCMDQHRSASVSFTIGKLGDATDCVVDVSTGEDRGRRFVQLSAHVRDVSTFYRTMSISELKDHRLVPYFDGFGGPDDETVAAGADGISPQLRSDWATLPTALRKWMQDD